MKKRKRIFQLLNEPSTKDKMATVLIKGSQTGATLYEGSLLYVPFMLCTDYVLRHEVIDGVLVIVSTYSPYREEA